MRVPGAIVGEHVVPFRFGSRDRPTKNERWRRYGAVERKNTHQQWLMLPYPSYLASITYRYISNSLLSHKRLDQTPLFGRKSENVLCNTRSVKF